MERRVLPHTSLEVSQICYGAMPFGSACDTDTAFRLIDRFRAAGGNFIDTAHAYSFWTPAGAGASERMLGDYLRRAGKGDLIIATKGGHPAAAGYRPAPRWLSPETIRQDMLESLARLGLDCIDLYWLHRDDTRVPVDEVIDLLDEYVRAGQVRAIGASNWHRDRIAAANGYARRAGRMPFCANQVKWNLATATEDHGPGTGLDMRQLSFADRMWHREIGLPVVAYSATAQGLFSQGKPRKLDQEVMTRLDRARALAERRGITPGQVALAWLLQQPFPVIPLIGTTNLSHLNEALKAADVPLADDELAWLEGRTTGNTS